MRQDFTDESLTTKEKKTMSEKNQNPINLYKTYTKKSVLQSLLKPMLKAGLHPCTTINYNDFIYEARHYK